MSTQLTVCLMNWKRPGNVVRLTRLYLAMPMAARVIVADCSEGSLPFCRGELADPRLLLFRFNHDPGLPVRFAAASLARTEAVLLADDDIELPRESVQSLLDLWLSLPSGPGLRRPAVGSFGRQPAVSGDYNPQVTSIGPVPVVLTRAVVVSRRLCAESLENTHRMVQALGGEPYGNGEDIVLSYTAMADGRLNQALAVPYKNLDYDDEHAISVRYSGHQDHRTRVVQWCRRHIADDRRLSQS